MAKKLKARQSMGLMFVSGSLGDGKTLYAVSKIRDYLAAGRRIATNINIDLEHVCSRGNRHSRVLRLPDVPTVEHFRNMGYGAPEGRGNGLLVLDELGLWFNSRDFSDKGRKDIIKFVIHLRKKGWDVLFLVQDVSMIDKQIRGGMTTYLATCRSSHRYFGWLKWLPRFHMVSIRNKDRIRSELEFLFWWDFKTLFRMYDTEQLYQVDDTQWSDDMDPVMLEKERRYHEQNTYRSVLPPGYYLPPLEKPLASPRRVMDILSGPRVAWAAAVLSCGMMLSSYLTRPATGAETMLAAAEPLPTGFGPEPAALPSAPVVPVEDPWEFGEQVYIGHYSRFGDQYTYSLVLGDQVLSSTKIAAWGYSVRAQGPDRLMLVSPTGKTFIVGTAPLRAWRDFPDGSGGSGSIVGSVRSGTELGAAAFGDAVRSAF